MGSFTSKESDKTVQFSASYAPTGKAKCKKCKGVIAKGTVRISREIKNNWTGDKGSTLFHYHLGHGMDTVRAVKCETGTPVMTLNSALSEEDAATVMQKFQVAKSAWSTGCQ